ncbi:3-dehydroquinate dehydratase [Granulibacter bethesdensis]|nr:3-dehydroquinate dehydratase [Granulibacter bethesdensis]
MLGADMSWTMGRGLTRRKPEPLKGWFRETGWETDWTFSSAHANARLMTRPLIAVLNGPNLNMLGVRQPEMYGSVTLDDVEALCAETAEELGLAVDFRQTNGEGELISWVQECRGRAAGIVINPAGYTHTSVALMDALLAVDLPVVEVHISNIHRRETFRRRSYVSQAADGIICGLGVRGYALALRAMADLLDEQTDLPDDHSDRDQAFHPYEGEEGA